MKVKDVIHNIAWDEVFIVGERKRNLLHFSLMKYGYFIRKPDYTDDTYEFYGNMSLLNEFGDVLLNVWDVFSEDGSLQLHMTIGDNDLDAVMSKYEHLWKWRENDQNK